MWTQAPTAAAEIQPGLHPVSVETQATILVVEDEAFVREATCDILESQGYRVLRARTAAEAEQVFHAYPGSVQLLLSDVVLPGKNGPALAERLTASRPSLKTLFISGYPLHATDPRSPNAQDFEARDFEARDFEARDFEAQDFEDQESFYLPKPFSAEALLAKIAEVLHSEDRILL